MFIFQYDGMFQKFRPGEPYSKKRLSDADLDAIVNLSKDYLGQEVVVIFDNNRDKRYKDKEKDKFYIGPDLVNSTFRKGILGKVDEKNIGFEDTSTLISTRRFIDMVRLQDLCNPEPSWVSPFIFQFFYHSRGRKTLKYVDPISAFKEGMLKYSRPGCNCEQAFLISSCSPAYDMRVNELHELPPKKFEELSLQPDFLEKQNFVIRCYRNTG